MEKKCKDVFFRIWKMEAILNAITLPLPWETFINIKKMYPFRIKVSPFLVKFINNIDSTYRCNDDIKP